MKKIMNIALAAVALSVAMTADISAKNVTARRMTPARKGRASAPARMRNRAKQVQMALNEAKKTDNPVVKQQAIKTANEAAKELLMNLQDRTWAGDVLGKYTPEQVAAAGKKYTDLEVQRQALERDIASKQAEIDAMSTKSMVFWTKAEGGKEEAHRIASQDLADMKATLRDVNKAMRNQAVIAGKEYCAAIRMAIGAITAVGIAGGAYGIDKYAYEGKGMTALGEKYTAARENLAMNKDEGYGAYVQRGLGKAWEGISAVPGYLSNKAGALKTYITDTTKYYWGSKAEAPKDVQKAAEDATKAQDMADKKQEIADSKPNDSKAQDAADTAQTVADSKAAALETVVDKEVAKQEEKGETPAGEVAATV